MQFKNEEDIYMGLLKIFNNLTETNEEKKREGIHDYSLINALLKKTDEVHLHSNFIYSMINPKGSHYHEGKFLELFLDAINESDFIDMGHARVHKEKGKIDLLVEDGEHYLIIENKLRAVDQKHQISRYIDYVIQNYLDGKNEYSHQKIGVVYLSEYKKKPSIQSESIIGFELKDGLLTRNDEAVLALMLPTQNSKISFNRVQHSDELWKWVEESKAYLEEKVNSKTLIYAFEEYRLILERLKNNNWRNIMSLDEYVLNKIDKKDEKKMYDFMSEASKRLNDYLYKKLYEEIDNLFPENERTELTLNSKKFKKFTKENCKKWFKTEGHKETYRDIGFSFNEKYFFALGEANIAYGLCSDGWKRNIKTNRKNLQMNSEKNIFDVVDDLKKLADK